MAFKKTFNLEGQGFVRTDGGNVELGNQKISFLAYCKINNITGTKENLRVAVECISENYRVVLTYNAPVSVDADAPNFIKQAYQHLKTLPEWADAMDC